MYEDGGKVVREGWAFDSVEKQRGIGRDREGEIGDRVANAGRVAAPLGGANGTIRSGRWKMEKRVCARTHGGKPEDWCDE